MKKFEVATEQDLNEQMNNIFLFSQENIIKNVKLKSFINFFKTEVCSISILGQEYTFSDRDDWSFAKTPNGFVFAYPNIVDGEELLYTSKMSHINVKTSPLIVGYSSTLIWISKNIGLAYNGLSISEEDLNTLIDAENKGEDHYCLNNFFTKEDVKKIDKITDKNYLL